jgi:hypothetical protein
VSLRIGSNGLWYVAISFTIDSISNISHQDRVRDARIGIDARMISHEKATLINSKINSSNSKLIYPPQNLVDLVWKDKPLKPKAPLFMQPIEFTGTSIPTPDCCNLCLILFKRDGHKCQAEEATGLDSISATLCSVVFTTSCHACSDAGWDTYHIIVVYR